MPLTPNQRSRLHLLQGRNWGFEATGSLLLGGFELYLHVCVCVPMLHPAGNLGQEQLGCMSGSLLCWETRPELGGSGGGGRPSSVALAPPSPWHLDACQQGQWWTVSGRWPMAAAATHCLCPLHISAFDRGPSSRTEVSPWRELPACCSGCCGLGGCPVPLARGVLA